MPTKVLDADSETKIVEEGEGDMISKPVAGQLSPIVIEGIGID